MGLKEGLLEKMQNIAKEQGHVYEGPHQLVDVYWLPWKHVPVAKPKGVFSIKDAVALSRRFANVGSAYDFIQENLENVDLHFVRSARDPKRPFVLIAMPRTAGVDNALKDKLKRFRFQA